jgi:WD40 repeat protein/tRNA A-37 threonylcarbamoyl transferase component Bud32
MPEDLICHQGHRWTPSVDAAANGSTPSACPVCGSNPVPAKPREGAVDLWQTVPPGQQVGSSALPESAATETVVANLLPGYEVQAVLGRGAMGVVYKARQLSLNRLVALKMVLSGNHAGPQERARFRAEAEAAAALQHPNIVQIYEVGDHDGLPFFCMELVDGGSLSQKTRGTPLPAREAARLVEMLARAVQYAHQHGVIHRDLKPANVLLTTDGEPKITDFGLAKRIQDDPQATRASYATLPGTAVGTPSYMAPEQAIGDGKRVGPLADVYSLGAVLYELLTGRPPFVAETIMDTLLLVTTEEPPSPSRLQPRLPRDLVTICLKCLCKEPEKRYASALELADDLKRFLAGEPIHAVPVTWRERLVKWVRRRPALAALMAVSAAALLALLLGGWLAALAQSRSNQALQLAHSNLEVADRANRRALVRLNVANGMQSLGDENVFGSLIWFARGLKLEEDPTREPSHRTRIAAVLRECPRLGQLWFHEESATDVTFSPDGRWVLTASYDKTARVWDAVTGKPRFADPLRHDFAILHASFSPDGQRILTASTDRTARIWDAVTGRLIATLTGHQGPVRDARFSPDGTRVVTGSSDATARIWDAAGSPLGAPLPHDAGVVRVSFHPDGKQVLTASEDGSARIWQLESGQVKRLKHDGPVTAASFSPDGTLVVTASKDQSARIWDTATGKPITAPLWHDAAVVQVVFRPDGRQVASVSADLVRVWDVKTGQTRIPVLWHRSPVTCVAFSPDGTRLVTASDDNTARLWDATTGRPLSAPVPHNGVVLQVCFSPDGCCIATASGDTTVRIYDLAPLAPTVPPLKHGSPVLRASFSPDGRRVLTASDDTTARIWDARTGEELAVLRGHTAAVLAAVFSGDGGRIVTASADATARVWDAAAYRPIVTLAGHEGPVRTANFSPDGRRVLTASDDTTARIWDSASGTLIVKLGHDSHYLFAEVLDAVFSPDGSRVATVSVDRTARLWDAASGKQVGQIMHHKRRVERVAFSPDGRQLATASSDRTAQLWDATTGQPLLRAPLQHAGAVWDVSFSRDGSQLLTCSDDNTVRTWSAVTGEPLLQGMRHNGSVGTARFSADSQRIATASADNSGRVWDAASGEPLTPVLRHRGWGRVTDIAFSPTGDRVVTASTDGTARVWRLLHNDWPVDDLERLAELLSGSRIGADAGSVVPLDVGALRRLWDDLRTRHPEAVGLSPRANE